MKRILMHPGIFVFLIVVMLSCSKSQRKREQDQIQLPNIILLMGDDHGWDETGYNGHPFVKTPVLDEMAASGMRFDRFYSGHANCSPTRGSFMTGRHPNRYGTFAPGWSIRPEEITIAHLAREAGYMTAHFGKWHLGPVKKESPTNPGKMGFDEFLSHDNFFELDPVFSRNGGVPQEYEGESSEIIIDQAIKFIEKAGENGKPCMVVVWFGSPHEPYSGLPGDLALYDDLPDSLNNRSVRLTSNETGEQTMRPLGDVLKERYAEITAMDRAIGVLRNYLRENNIRDNSLLLYCGDNGTPPSAARTGMTVRAQKGSLYEGGILVPGVLEWPAMVKKPSATNTIAVTSDFLPTFAELFGAPLPARPIDGISLLPLINNPRTQREEPLFFWKFNSRRVPGDSIQNYIDSTLQEGTTPLAKKMDGKYTRSFQNQVYEEILESDFEGERAIMLKNLKLVIGGESPNEQGYELYDIVNDRAETLNIADSHPEKVDELNKQLRKWQESVLNSLKGEDYK